MVGTSLTVSAGAVLELGISNICAGLNKAGIGRTAWGIAKGESSGEATCVRAGAPV